MVHDVPDSCLLVTLVGLGWSCWHRIWLYQVIGCHHWGRMSLWPMALCGGVGRWDGSPERYPLFGVEWLAICCVILAQHALTHYISLHKTSLLLDSIVVCHMFAMKIPCVVMVAAEYCEAYYLEKDRWVPNDDTPLVWTQSPGSRVCRWNLQASVTFHHVNFFLPTNLFH